jgi:NADPH-dependent curcumin reductase CurA
VSAACTRLCPDGVDVIFARRRDARRVSPPRGGHARVVLCGGISRYEGGGDPAPLSNWFHLLPNRARMEGFIYADHEARFDDRIRPRIRD